MPYIVKDRRYDIVAPEGAAVSSDEITNAGELNFAITFLVNEYFQSQGGRYQQINDVLGALEGAKQEFYRRVAAPYEDKKIAENGDVY